MDDSLDIQPIPEAKADDDLDIQPIPKQQRGASSIPGAEQADQQAQAEAQARAMGPPASAAGFQLLPPNAINAAAQAPQDIAQGALATGLNTLTGGVIAPAAGFITQFGGKETGPEAAKRISEDLSYTPSSEGAQNVAENLGKVMEPLVALGPMNLHAPGLMRERGKAGVEATHMEKLDALHEQIAKDTALDIQPIPEAAPDIGARPTTENPTVAVDRNGVAYPPGTDVAQSEAFRQQAEAKQAAEQPTGNPVAAAMSPMEHMATNLGASAELHPGEQSPVMDSMAKTLAEEPRAQAATAVDNAEGSRQGRFEMTPEQVAKGTFGSQDADHIIRSDDGLTYTAHRDGEPVGKLIMNMSPEDNARLGHDPAYPATVSSVTASEKGKGIGTALYDQMRADHGDNVLPSGQTTPDAWNYWKRNGADKVAEFVKQEGARAIQDPSVIRRITDSDVRRQVAESAQVQSYTPGEPITLLHSFGHHMVGVDSGVKDVLKGMGVFSPKFASFRENKLQGPELIKHIEDSGVGDVAGSKVMQTVAGGTFATEASKGHPLVKFGVDEVRGASDRAHAAEQQLIANNYARKARALSDDEKVAAYTAIKAQEKAGINYTPEQLAKMGFNPKELAFIDAHREIAGAEMLKKLNAGQKAAGMSEVHPEAAYVASRVSGDFRKSVFDGDKHVGFIGEDTRQGLAREEAKWKEAYPHYTTGPEQYAGGGMSRGRLADNFHEMLDFLQNSDAGVKAFLDASKTMRDAETASYRGVQTHTMAKKGIMGMEGNKPFASALQNAKEGIQAQVKYMNKVIGYSEFAAAKARMEPVLSHFTEKMPNAVEYVQKYADQAMGRNPYDLGRKVQDMFASANKTMGGGFMLGNKQVVLKNIPGAARTLGNLKMIGGNIISLLNQAKDPFVTMPGVANMMRNRGLKVGPTGYIHTFKALQDQLKMSLGAEVDPHVKAADKWAKDNGVYSSGLFNSSQATSPSLAQSAKAAASMPHNAVEKWSRQNAFLASVDMLKKNGGTADNGMFYSAKKMTDIMMGSHLQSEKPMALSMGAGLGKSAYNLGSWKAAELSRLHLFTSELKNNKSLAPLAAHVAMTAAAGGLMAAPLYNEVDALIRGISWALDKPTSLTNILMQYADKEIKLPMTNIPISVFDALYGIPGQMGLDMHQRSGVGNLSPFDIGGGFEAMAPGINTLTQPVKDLASNALDPGNKFMWQRTVRDALPSAVQGAVDRAWFSQPNAKGEELPIDRNHAKGLEPRNAADKFWKTLGGTGSNESFENAKLEESRMQDATVKNITERWKDEMATRAYNKQDLSGLAKKYTDLTLKDPKAAIDEAYTDGKIDAKTRDLMQKQRDAAAISRRFR